MANCCPPPASLPSVSASSCNSRLLNEIYSVGFQRLGYTWATGIDDQVEFTTTLAAIDDTKLTLSPILYAPSVVAGEPFTETGRDNTDQPVGVSGTTFTFELRNVDQAGVIVPLKDIACEVNAGRVGIYLIDTDDTIVASGDADPTTAKVFRALSMVVQDLGATGVTESNKNIVTITLEEGWSDTAYKYSPNGFSYKSLVP